MAVNAEPGDDYGKIRLLQLPRNTTVPGPEQVQNNFQANPDVAGLLNILGRGDSTVIYGNLLTLPLGGGLLYVEPVYVRSSGDGAYPLLQRVLVAFGDRIAFEPTLPEALDSLFAGRVTETPVDARAGHGQPTPSPSASPTAPATPAPGGTAPPAGSLDAALLAADLALADAENALKRGDFAAYGEAQERLEAAIERAIALQRWRACHAAPTAAASPAPTAGTTTAPAPG